MKRSFVRILAVVSAMLVMLLSQGTVLADEVTATDEEFTVTTDVEDGYTFYGSVLTINSGGEYTITGDSVAHRIDIAADEDVIITLNYVSINADIAKAPILISGSGDVTIKLKGENTIVSTKQGCAGLQKDTTDNTLTITSASGDGSTDGTLIVTGQDYAAGIGGGRYSDGNNIIIKGGTITATGGAEGAGIGGGDIVWGRGINSSNITITGGIVTATGGNGAAGIGGGHYGTGSDITISGGTVTATGGSYGAGIGGGSYGSGSNITISGGTVTANTGGFAAGIGGGSYGSGSHITITAGTVSTHGGSYGGAGIGGGREGSGSHITINGGNVTASGWYYSAGIGGGMSGSGSYITINGGNVTASGATNAAGIGGGQSGSGSEITISAGTVKASGGTNAAGIGGGQSGSGNDIVISGGYITLSHGTDGTYIGNGNECEDETSISITGGYFGVGDTETDTVYDISVENGYEVDDNGDDSTKDTYPYVVAINNPAFSITTDVVDGYTYKGGFLNIKSGGEYKISMREGFTSTSTDRIYISANEAVTITLSGLSIVSDSASPLDINADGDVTLKLDGVNTLTSNRNSFAGLQKTSSDNILIITSVSGDGETDGSLNVTGGRYAAGIGNCLGSSGDNIIINGGTITATGGYNGAGIGGGITDPGSTITINGGVVTANAGSSSAAIGGGYWAGGSDITINGGIVTANGGTNSAVIGGGYYGSGSDIIINGGYIIMTCGDGGCYIGSGYNGDTATDISITGGYFGTGDKTAYTVYDVSVADGYKVIDNEDGETSAAYPVCVVINVTFGAQDTDSGKYYPGDDDTKDLYGVIRFLQEYTGTYGTIEKYGFYFLDSANGEIIDCTVSIYNDESLAVEGFYGDVVEIAADNYDDLVYAKAFVVIDGETYYSDVFSGTVGSDPKLVSDPTATDSPSEEI